MLTNQISEEITQQTLSDVLGHLEAVHTALPFLVGLSPLERQRMIKAGDASLPFISKALDVAPYLADYLPRGLDLAEVKKDVDLLNQLSTIMVATTRLAEKLSDTHALVIGEAYAGALQIYRSAKQAEGKAGLEEPVREMRARFARGSSPDEATAPDIEPPLPVPVPVPDAD